MNGRNTEEAKPHEGLKGFWATFKDGDLESREDFIAREAALLGYKLVLTTKGVYEVTRQKGTVLKSGTLWTIAEWIASRGEDAGRSSRVTRYGDGQWIDGFHAESLRSDRGSETGRARRPIKPIWAEEARTARQAKIEQIVRRYHWGLPREEIDLLYAIDYDKVQLRRLARFYGIALKTLQERRDRAHKHFVGAAATDIIEREGLSAEWLLYERRGIRRTRTFRYEAAKKVVEAYIEEWAVPVAEGMARLVQHG